MSKTEKQRQLLETTRQQAKEILAEQHIKNMIALEDSQTPIKDMKAMIAGHTLPAQESVIKTYPVYIKDGFENHPDGKAALVALAEKELRDFHQTEKDMITAYFAETPNRYAPDIEAKTLNVLGSRHIQDIVDLVENKDPLSTVRDLKQSTQKIENNAYYLEPRIQKEAQKLGKGTIKELHGLASYRPSISEPQHKDKIQQQAMPDHKTIDPEIRAVAKQALNIHHQKETIELANQYQREEYALQEQARSHHIDQATVTTELKQLTENFEKDKQTLDQLHAHEKAQFDTHDKPIEETLIITNDYLNFDSFDNYVNARIQEAENVLEIKYKAPILEQAKDIDYGDLDKSEAHIREHLQTKSVELSNDNAPDIPGLLESKRTPDKFERNMWASSWSDITTPLQEQKSLFNESQEHTVDWQTHNFDAIETDQITARDIVEWQHEGQSLDHDISDGFDHER